MLDSIFETVVSDQSFTLINAFIALGASLVLGLFLAFVRGKTSSRKILSQDFTHTLVILPAVVTIIILLVGNSMARAFSLAGAFAIIRFRSAPGNPKDITYVLFSMALGLCCGMGYLTFAGIAAVVLCIAMVLLEITHFGKLKEVHQVLKITMPENLDYNGAFDDIFKKYTKYFERMKVKTADLGSLYVVQYAVCIKADADEKAFLDELRCRNGNLNIALVLWAENNEEF